MYGLNDAARKWHLTVKSFLLRNECYQVKADPAAFYWYDRRELCGMFLLHVDNFCGQEQKDLNILSLPRLEITLRSRNKIGISSNWTGHCTG